MFAVETYLRNNIDDHVEIKPWTDNSKIPIFYREQYTWYGMSLLGVQCILLKVVDAAPDIDTIKKHFHRIEELVEMPVVFFYKSMSGYRRKSLISHRISFLMEDGQMFLPFLGLQLRKAVEEAKRTKQEYFSPSTQLAYIYFLNNKDAEINTTELAKVLRYTPMTTSRALQYLYDAGLLTYRSGGKTGRSKEYRRIDDPEYFQKGSGLLSSPVKQIVFVKDIPDGTLVSGLEMLSQLSMLNFPGHHIRAIGQDGLATAGLEFVWNREIAQDENWVELEVWKYDPQQFSVDGQVDVLSLYTILREMKDERVELALADVLGRKSWYVD